MLKAVVVGLLVISFGGLSMFGLQAMSHPGGSTHGDCFMLTPADVDCTTVSNSLYYISLHLKTIKGFGFASLFTALTLLLAAILASRSSVLSDRLRKLIFYSRHAAWAWAEFFVAPAKQTLLAWQSLHENSPTRAF